jgi:hypothetical protein
MRRVPATTASIRERPDHVGPVIHTALSSMYITMLPSPDRLSRRKSTRACSYAATSAPGGGTRWTVTYAERHALHTQLKENNEKCTLSPPWRWERWAVTAVLAAAHGRQRAGCRPWCAPRRQTARSDPGLPFGYVTRALRPGGSNPYVAVRRRCVFFAVAHQAEVHKRRLLPCGMLCSDSGRSCG